MKITWKFTASCVQSMQYNETHLNCTDKLFRFSSFRSLFTPLKKNFLKTDDTDDDKYEADYQFASK